MKIILTLLCIFLKVNIGFGQYPIKTIFKGDSVVILTVKQSEEINKIIESQQKTILRNQKELGKIKAQLDSIHMVNEMLFIDAFEANEILEYCNFKVVNYEDSMKNYEKIIKIYNSKTSVSIYWDEKTKKEIVYNMSNYILYQDKKGELKIKKR